MKLKLVTFLAFFQSVFIFGIPFLENFFTLGDRERYISNYTLDEANEFNRTILTDLVFNYGGRWLEIILGILSIFLHFYLINCFSNTLKVSKFNRYLSIIWLFLPVHFILRSIAGKELLASIFFCFLIIILYPFLFSNVIDSKYIPGYFFRKDKRIMIPLTLLFIILLAYIRPFFLLIFLLLLIPYFYRKIRLTKISKKYLYIILFLFASIAFIYFGELYYNSIQKYISLNFVGTGDSTYTNPLIPTFDSFFSYLTFLFLNIFNAMTGSSYLILSGNIGQILLAEGLISLIPIALLLSKNLLRFLFIPKFKLSEGFTSITTFILLILIYSLLGYVNFLAGWRLQSGSWILYILLYLKITKTSNLRWTFLHSSDR